jgi:hypothetical protein
LVVCKLKAASVFRHRAPGGREQTSDLPRPEQNARSNDTFSCALYFLLLCALMQCTAFIICVTYMPSRRTRRLCLLIMLLTASEFDGVYGMLAAAGCIFSQPTENLAGRMHLFVWRRRRLFVFLQVPECSAEIDLCTTYLHGTMLEKGVFCTPSVHDANTQHLRSNGTACICHLLFKGAT